MRKAALSERPLRLVTGVVCLAALLAVELLIISIWLDTGALSGGRRLVALLHDWGAWGVRIGVAFLVFSLVFAESRAERRPRPISGQVLEGRIAWSWLAIHFCAMALFVGLSSFLFDRHPSGILADITVFGWLAVGLLAASMAALAFLPATIWLQFVKSNMDAWAYCLTACIAAYLLGSLAWGLWQPLSRLTFTLVRILLHPFMPGLISDPSNLSIGSPTFTVIIAPECSGYEGIGLVLAFAAAWLWFLRREWRFPLALLLLPAGAIAIWIFNCLRIAALILIGHAGAPRVALGGFHSQAGWIGFTAVTIGLCVGARHLSWLTTTRSAMSGGSSVISQNLATSYLVPFLAVLASALIARGAAADFEWLYPLRVLAAAAALWWFRRSYQKLDWRPDLTAMAMGGLVFSIWLGVDYFTSDHLAHPMPAVLAQAPPLARLTWLAFRVAGAVVTVPITEELAYRAFLMRRLISRSFESVSWQQFSWLPIVVSSVAYGALHGRQWLAGTIAGFLFAFALLRRGRIGDAVAAHATANGLITAWVIIGGNWQMW